MGIQFRLGPTITSQLKTSRPASTRASTPSPSIPRLPVTKAAAAAVDAGLQVYREPAAERLADDGFLLDKFPLSTGQPYDIDNLSADQAARAALVGLTVEPMSAIFRTGSVSVTKPRSAPQRAYELSESPRAASYFLIFVADPPRIRHSCEKSATSFENRQVEFGVPTSERQPLTYLLNCRIHKT
jgi:hypothetical protein